MLKIETKTDVQISEKEYAEILTLLNASFDNIFDNRIFFKQIPHKRFLAKENDIVIGQVSIDYRITSLGEKLIGVVGIIDLCVVSEYQGKGIGTKMGDCLMYKSIKKGVEWTEDDLDMMGYLY